MAVADFSERFSVGGLGGAHITKKRSLHLNIPTTIFAYCSYMVVSADRPLVPIAHHGVLSDQRTASLVTPDGRVVWLCAPRLDDPALFAELLDTPSAGFFAIGSADGSAPTGQRYLGNTMTLETSWETMAVVDYLDCSEGLPSTPAGRSNLIRVVDGTGTVKVDFAPRFDFGATPTSLQVAADGLVVFGGSFSVALRSPGVDWAITEDGGHQTASATIDLANAPVVLELRLGTSDLESSPADESLRRDQTAAYWSEWTDSLSLPDTAPDAVLRSALALRALVYQPTGAIAAAATTSLPENIGGVRNWDYRYCWLRDGSMTATALARLGSVDEGLAFLDWMSGLLNSAGGHTENLKPLYTLDGGSLPPEIELPLRGYAESLPVRTGNAADHQVQTDVFGPVVELAHALMAAGATLTTAHWALIEELVRAVSIRWTDADQGIWEVRSAPRHHTYSKVMCWFTVDRAITIGRAAFGEERPVWHQLRDDIRQDVLANGWHESVNSFTTAYDGEDLDASVLFLGLSGFLSPDDPRLASTVQAVEAQLRVGDTVYRYHHEDGLTGGEGGFHLMTSWLIDSLVLLGEVDRAQSLFESFIGCAGPTGLMTEEVDPDNGTALGNYPQAYSHLGIINNALRLAAAVRSAQ